ncbi:tyrosine-type recombinase/integrase [Alkalihalobacterium alkalinitrilicum]|uniref:tyrosine-type recombinase/integrase n=1 Tax=Alkalihalobacterium alkalinitrilicum TaxID=427920 RepID=UPI000994DB54|nr:site-specific integrase [Alkalihalobacterium alkalinitrilicum]
MTRRSNFFSSELSKVHKKSKSFALNFNTSLNLFTDDCKLRNLRPHTISYYLNELSVYERYLKEQNLEPAPSKVTRDHINKNIILYMKEQGLKTVTINTRLRAIRSYFNFLYKQKYIRNNPMDDVKLLKDRKAIVQKFSQNN